MNTPAAAEAGSANGCRTRSADEQLAIACCSAALASTAVIAAYQAGVIDRLPDPPGRIFDSERITCSRQAHIARIPDGYLGVLSYAATMALLLEGGRVNGQPSRPAALALHAKLALDGSMAAINVVRQIKDFGRICSWCMGTAAATGAMLWFSYRAGKARRQARG